MEGGVQARSLTPVRARDHGYSTALQAAGVAQHTGYMTAEEAVSPCKTNNGPYNYSPSITLDVTEQHWAGLQVSPPSTSSGVCLSSLPRRDHGTNKSACGGGRNTRDNNIRVSSCIITELNQRVVDEV